MNINRLFTNYRVVTIRNVLFNIIQKEKTRNLLQLKEFHASAPRVMAQRTITSFFNVTPPKKAGVKSDKVEKAKNNETNIEEAPFSKEIEKKPSKRSRVASSESDTGVKSPEIKSEKKKKVKRQRIESSGSESESTKSDNDSEKSKEPPSPVTNTSPNEKEKESPTSQELTEKTIKVEKSENLKTYASPKSKTRKSNVLSEKVTPKVATDEIEVKKEVSIDESPEKKKVNGAVKTENDKENDDADIVPEAEYNPSLVKYHPIEHACWRRDQPVPYLALARTLELIEGTSARLRMVDILANYFRSVIALTPQDLLPSVYMCLNQLAPAYHSLELGVAETYLLKAVGASTGRSVQQMRAAARRAGDLGAAAAAARATQRTMFTAPKLLLRTLFSDLRALANMTGQASVNKKISKIQSLFVACRHSEAKYLIRSLEGKLRIGLAEQSVLQALAQAVALTPPPLEGGEIVLDASRGVPADVFKSRVESHALTIKTTYCECPTYELLVPALLKYGVAQLGQHCRLSVGIPLKPMLAHPSKGVHEVFNRFEGERFTCEWKYDGERAQLHLPCLPARPGEGEGGQGERPDFSRAAVFSRNQEDNTTKYPDIIRRLPSLVRPSVSSCVLDCEAVAYDTDNKQILPFQVLSTRKRKGAVESEIKVQVCVFVFDLLLLNGRSLVRESLLTRRALLREHFLEVPGEWQFATSKDCTEMEEVQQFLEEAVKGSCEGLMIKTLEGDNARYDIARRSHNWLKLKKDYLDGVGDTIDVCIIGAYSGRGKRRALYGGFLAAAWDPHTERFQALCKLGTGFSDEDLFRLTEELGKCVIDGPRNYYDVDRRHEPDVWLSAAQVWEVRCADLSLSPAHRAALGLVDPERGISLRFPRFVRVREDKTPEQATTAQQIAQMYLAQDQVRNQANRNKQNVDDFY